MNFMDMQRPKYPRTPHVPWSEGATSDDKWMASTALTGLVGRRVVVTKKLDGENTTMYSDIIHARSVDGRSHVSRDWVKAFWGTLRSDIPPQWRICGENLYAKHSIFYDDLESYFYGFSIWDDRNVCLSWDRTLEWFDLLGIVPVPVLYDGIFDEAAIRKLWTPKDRDTLEGYVLRAADEVRFEDFSSNFAKFVRKGHVTTDEHWMTAEIVPNRLR